MGIDLHGTLLGKNWFIREDLIKPLNDALSKLSGKIKIYTCTGNDISFVKGHIPFSTQKYFSGHVLENGCVISNKDKETIITTKEERETIKDLEEKIKERKFCFDFMGRRLSSITLFTKNPQKLYREIDNFLKKETINEVDFFWSDVAVDIVPSGYNKYTGLKSISNNEKTIAIADSMNDAPLITKVNYGFIPANAPKELLTYIKKSGKRVIDIKTACCIESSQVIQADKERTEGTIEILNFIVKFL